MIEWTTYCNITPTYQVVTDYVISSVREGVVVGDIEVHDRQSNYQSLYNDVFANMSQTFGTNR